MPLQDWLYHASESSMAKRRLWFVVENIRWANLHVLSV